LTPRREERSQSGEATDVTEFPYFGKKSTTVPATRFPPLLQVLAKGFRHTRPRLHPIPFRQGVKAQPSIQSPTVQAELFRHFGDLQACRSHPVQRLEEFHVFLPPLPSSLHLLLPHVRLDRDLPTCAPGPTKRHWRLHLQRLRRSQLQIIPFHSQFPLAACVRLSVR
jgi:hypothetical protein